MEICIPEETPSPMGGQFARVSQDFRDRVFARTGKKIEKGEIALGFEQDLNGGQIVAREGNCYVVTHGYPDEDDDGPVYRDWRFVVVEQPADPWAGYEGS